MVICNSVFSLLWSLLQDITSQYGWFIKEKRVLLFGHYLNHRQEWGLPRHKNIYFEIWIMKFSCRLQMNNFKEHLHYKIHVCSTYKQTSVCMPNVLLVPQPGHLEGSRVGIK